jgi:hypothetical protein
MSNNEKNQAETSELLECRSDQRIPMLISKQKVPHTNQNLIGPFSFAKRISIFLEFMMYNEFHNQRATDFTPPGHKRYSRLR